MKQDIKRRWISALRFSNYKQGLGALRSKDDCFCCLGVLCDVFNPTGWKRNAQGGDYRYNYESASQSGILPSTLRYEVEMLRDKEDILIDLNDSGKSFEEIADWIEQNL